HLPQTMPNADWIRQASSKSPSCIHGPNAHLAVHLPETWETDFRATVFRRAMRQRRIRPPKMLLPFDPCTESAPTTDARRDGQGLAQIESLTPMRVVVTYINEEVDCNRPVRMASVRSAQAAQASASIQWCGTTSRCCYPTVRWTISSMSSPTRCAHDSNAVGS